MSILSRIKNIVNASLNDLLDKVEDPEKMINQLIREMDQAIIELRRDTAAAITSRKMAESKLEKLQSDHKKWQGNAELAVEKGDDELALKALEKRKDVEERIKLFEAEVSDASDLVEKLKKELKEVEEKVQQARSKRDTLITKKRTAETRKKLLESSDRFNKHVSSVHSSASQIINGFDSFNKYEDEIDRKLAEVEAEKELREELNEFDIDNKFDSMKVDDDLKSELDALKKSKGKKGK